ncbi:hypothetical protein PFISCL1PPCAC_18836, partial [Pristionchus fissidentatus]
GLLVRPLDSQFLVVSSCPPLACFRPFLYPADRLHPLRFSDFFLLVFRSTTLVSSCLVFSTSGLPRFRSPLLSPVSVTSHMIAGEQYSIDSKNRNKCEIAPDPSCYHRSSSG